MIIRDERPADAQPVHALVSAAFGRAEEAELVQALHRDGDAVISLLAEQDGALLGHVLLSRMSAPFPALALAPLSVAPARQGQGIGTALAREAVARAGERGFAAVFVLGDPAYYRRFGFDTEAAKGFSSPYAGEHLMALALQLPLPAREGALEHAPAFAALD